MSGIGPEARPPRGVAAPNAIDPSLQRAIAAIVLPGLLIGHRLISPGDEDALLADEAASITTSVIAARRASGAARIVARQLLARLGHAGCPLPRGASGEPIWPAGIAGSLAHDDRVAVAAAGRQADVGAVGIDIEPAVALPPDMLALIATPRELRRIADDPLRGRLLFAAKEAVYKALYPVDRVFLEFHDIEVDLAGRTATTRTGRAVALQFCISSHVLVLASG
jgi:4'-phosphopantetheinyl transferase EntD